MSKAVIDDSGLVKSCNFELQMNMEGNGRNENLIVEVTRLLNC